MSNLFYVIIIITLPHGQSHVVLGEFVYISGEWMLLCKVIITAGTISSQMDYSLRGCVRT